MQNIYIRPCRPKDIESINSIEKKVFPDPYPEEVFLWHQIMELEGFLVAELENEIIGYVITSTEEGGHVVSIAIKPEKQRKGLGSTLLKKGLDYLKKAGLNQVRAEVRVSNYPSQKFFEKHGFKKIKIIPRYYRNGENAILYQRPL